MTEYEEEEFLRKQLILSILKLRIGNFILLTEVLLGVAIDFIKGS